MTHPPSTILVLAGQRLDKVDPLAAARGRFAIDVDDRTSYEVTERLLLADGPAPGRS